MRKVQTVMNYDHKKQKGEKNSRPSKTIPDQSLSIKEILDRYARGIPIDAGKVPIWHDEDDMSDVRRMDLTELQELQEQTKKDILELSKRAKEEEEERKKLKSEKEEKLQRYMKAAEEFEKKLTDKVASDPNNT